MKLSDFTILKLLRNKQNTIESASDIPTDSTHQFVTNAEKTTWNGKQNSLVDGVNIKTIDSVSLLGSGDIATGGHTQNTDTGLGTLSTKNPPIDADKAIYRD